MSGTGKTRESKNCLEEYWEWPLIWAVYAGVCITDGTIYCWHDYATQILQEIDYGGGGNRQGGGGGGEWDDLAVDCQIYADGDIYFGWEGSDGYAIRDEIHLTHVLVDLLNGGFDSLVVYSIRINDEPCMGTSKWGCVVLNCAADGEVLAHEVGHKAGCDHEEEIDHRIMYAWLSFNKKCTVWQIDKDRYEGEGPNKVQIDNIIKN